MKVEISTEFIKLEQLLKFSSICQTGGEAKNIILDSQVKVNGDICLMRGKKLRTGDKVQVFGDEIEVV